jgi:hypothetical protein
MCTAIRADVCECIAHTRRSYELISHTALATIRKLDALRESMYSSAMLQPLANCG